MNIWWIRRDFRLGDNQALTSALQGGEGVIPVFILDDHLLKNSAGKRQQFLFAGLKVLDQQLRRLGSRLVLRKGDPVVEIPRLVSEIGAARVYAEEDITPYAMRRDSSVARWVDLRLVSGLSVLPVSVVHKKDGDPYTVFSPFSRAWKSFPVNRTVLPAPAELSPVPKIKSVTIDSASTVDFFPAGEQEAQDRLDFFLKGPIQNYVEGRNRLDLDGTSSLSPYFHLGMLSSHQAITLAHQAERANPDPGSRSGYETWVNELVWREFFQSILFHFPSVKNSAFRTSMRNLNWRESASELLAWKSGETGYPVVDAGMRQLAATGWMHNRARMITASFLVKHLLINWQEGERWFMRMLIDGDLASNNGGWQWVAGTGTDAVPYFRIFNPILQGKKFDPEAIYIRRWVPELENVPNEFIHTPWKMSQNEQMSVNFKIGRDYPLPLVDHDFARQRALTFYSRK